MKITRAIAFLLGKATALDPPTNGNFFYVEFPDLRVNKGGHGQHQVDLRVPKSGKLNDYESYPLFVTT